MGGCRETSDNKVFVFKEQRSTLTLNNTNQVASTKVHVDGCEINDDGIRCDFMHLAKGIEMYIELKGQDIPHAIEQIERTIALLSVDAKKCKKIAYIICTRSPLSSTQIQIYGRDFKKKHNATLIVKSSPHSDSY